MLMKELDEERERRWKAEQATRRLVNTVKEMQEKRWFIVFLVIPAILSLLLNFENYPDCKEIGPYGFSSD